MKLKIGILIFFSCTVSAMQSQSNQFASYAPEKIISFIEAYLFNTFSVGKKVVTFPHYKNKNEHYCEFHTTVVELFADLEKKVTHLTNIGWRPRIFLQLESRIQAFAEVNEKTIIDFKQLIINEFKNLKEYDLLEIQCNRFATYLVNGDTEKSLELHQQWIMNRQSIKTNFLNGLSSAFSVHALHDQLPILKVIEDAIQSIEKKNQ